MGTADIILSDRPPSASPHALIVGTALREAAADFIETALRRMGLQPRRVAAADGGDGAVFALTFGAVTATIARADRAALDAADPADPATSSLAAALPPDWREGGGCWIVAPDSERAPPPLDSATMREFFKLLVMLIDLLDASHLHWSPARLWSDAPQFRAAVAEMLASGMPPVLHLIAFRRREDRGEAVVATRGLVALAGQEIEAIVPSGWTMADMVKRLARLAIDLMVNGAVRDAQAVPGLDRGEIVRLMPLVDGDPPPLVRIDFDRGG